MITEKKLLSYILHIGNKVSFFLDIIRLFYKLQIQDFLIFDLFGIMKLAHSIYLEVIQPMHQ